MINIFYFFDSQCIKISQINLRHPSIKTEAVSDERAWAGNDPLEVQTFEPQKLHYNEVERFQLQKK